MTRPASSTIVELLGLLHGEWIKCSEFLELLAHTAGQKSVVRLVGDSERQAALRAFLETVGLQYRISTFYLKKMYSTTLGDTFQSIQTRGEAMNQDRVIFVGLPDATAEAHEMELNGADSFSCGRIYEYPECCARSYVIVQEGSPWVIPFLGGIASIRRYDWKLNKLASLFPPHLTIIPDFFPCSISCQPTAMLAARYEKLLIDSGLDQLRDLIATELRRPLLIHAGWIYRFEKLENGGTEEVASVGRTAHLPVDAKPRQEPISIERISIADDRVKIITNSQMSVQADGPLLLFGS